MIPPPLGTFALHLLDVGQGEAILLDLPNGDFALIDGGPSPAARVVLDAISHRSGRCFRFAALTHWDDDHVAGLPAILRARRPEELVQPNIPMPLFEQVCSLYEKPTLPLLRNAVEDAAREQQLEPLSLGARGQIRDIGDDIEIWALSPGRSALGFLAAAAKSPRRESFRKIRNAASLVLWIRVFGRALLLPGEVGADMATEFRQQFGDKKGRIHHDDPRAIWIKLSHHGSKTGTSDELLRIFAQDTFVASASHGARHGHPHPRVLHAVRSINGVAMCTRLGKGCRMTLQDPVAYPSTDPAWAETVKWNDQPPVSGRCYGGISITVAPGGACAVSGAVSERGDCPYGGPSDGRYTFTPPLQLNLFDPLQPLARLVKSAPAGP